MQSNAEKLGYTICPDESNDCLPSFAKGDMFHVELDWKSYRLENYYRHLADRL